MANIKFSAFTQKVVTGNVDFLVGYTGGDNVRISPAIFSDTYLPRAGGLMTGTLNLSDNVKAIWGNGSDLQIYHDTSHSFISEQGTGSLITLATDYQLNNAANTQNMMTATDGGAVTLFTAGAGKLATTATGVSVTGNIELTEDVKMAGGKQILWQSGNAAIKEGSVSSYSLSFNTWTGAALTSKMFITSNSGTVIGTTAPAHALHVDMTAAVATNPSYIVATAGSFEMAMGAENAPGVRQESFIGTLGNTDFKIKTNSVDIGRFTTTKKFIIGKDGAPTSTIQAFTGGNTVHAAMHLQHDSFAAGRLCGIGFELGSTQIKSAIAVKADDAAIGTNGRSNIIFCVDSVDDANPVTHNDEKMRLTHTGKLGINTQDPEATLQVGTIPQAGGSTTTADSLAHFVADTTPSTVNGFATLKLEHADGVDPLTPGAQIMFTQGYHSGDTDNTQPVGSLRGWRTGADTQYGGGLQLTYQPDGLPLGLLAGLTLSGDGRVGIGVTDPDAKLHVQSSNGAYPFDSNNHLVVEASTHAYIGIGGGTASDVGIHFGDSGRIDSGRIAYKNSDDSMRFNTNQLERMSILGTGLNKINSSSSGDHNAYQKTGTYTKTSTGSTTAMDIVKVGHTHAVNYTVVAKVDTSNQGVLVGNTSTAYGSNGGIIVDSEAYAGVISDIAVTYDNSFYGFTVAVTYTGASHPTIYMAVTGQSSEDFVQQ